MPPARSKAGKTDAKLRQQNEAAIKIQVAARKRLIRQKTLRNVNEARLRAEEEAQHSPAAIMAELDQQWADERRRQRLPGYVSSLVSSVPRSRSKSSGILKSGSLTSGMSKLDILRSGSPAMLRDGPFGPGGPTDKDLIGAILDAAEAKRVEDVRAGRTSVGSPWPNSWRELSSARPPPSPPRAGSPHLAKTPASAAPYPSTDGSSSSAASVEDGHHPDDAGSLGAEVVADDEDEQSVVASGARALVAAGSGD